MVVNWSIVAGSGRNDDEPAITGSSTHANVIIKHKK